MRNGCASAVATIVPAAIEPNRTLRRCIETAVSVDPVVQEIVRIDPTLGLWRLRGRLARPAAEQAAIVARLLVRLLIRRLRRSAVAAARAAVIAVVVAVGILPVAVIRAIALGILLLAVLVAFDAHPGIQLADDAVLGIVDVAARVGAERLADG